MFNNTNNIITAEQPVPSKIHDNFLPAETNAEFISLNRQTLEKATEWYLPSFPEYRDVRNKRSATKTFRFGDMPDSIDNLSEEIRSWLLDKIADGMKYGSVYSSYKHIMVAAEYIRNEYPEVRSALEITPLIIAEINKETKFFGDKSEIRRIKGDFRHFVEDTTEKLSIATIAWTPEMEMQRRKWRLDKLDIPWNDNPTRRKATISLECIEQDWFFEIVSKYIYYRLQVVSISSINHEITTLGFLSEYLEDKPNDVTALEQLNEQDGMNIISLIGAKGYKPSTRNTYINALINFLQIAFGIGLVSKDMSFIFHSYRPAKKVYRDPEVYSQAEILRIVSVLKYMEDNVARAAYVIISMGLRATDALTMKCDDTMIIGQDGTPAIQTLQHKTKKLINIPCIDEVTVQMFEAAVAESRKRFGPNCVYAFAKNETDPLPYDYVRNQLINTLIQHDVRDDNGKPIKLRLHQFRRTKASDYINISKLPPAIAAKLLGQGDPRSLGHYVNVSDSQLRDAARPVYAYFNSLIVNRGNIHEAEMCREGTAIRLKDGFCVRPLNSGFCTKIGGCWACRFFTAAASDLPYFKVQLEGLKLSFEQAEKTGFTLIAEQTADKIHNLEKIIEGIEAKNNAVKGV